MESELLQGLGSGSAGRVIVARIAPGADLLLALHDIVRRTELPQGLILSGVGALQRAVFRNVRGLPKEFPVTDKDRLYLEINQPLELLSLSGHISRQADGKPVVHAHFSASTIRGDDVITLGGHLTARTIASIKVTVAVLALQDIAMQSVFDPLTQSEDLAIGQV